MEPSPLRARIIETSLELAHEVGWEDVRLHAVAERVGLTLAEIGALFRDVDAIANAWFEQALHAVQELPPEALEGLPPPERLETVVMRWFDALAPHREVTAQMLGQKLYLSHPHHWVPMVFDLSRLIHWFLDAARIGGTGRLRQAEEIGLTALFVSTLAVWTRDASPAQERTRAFLRRGLANSDRVLATFLRRRP